MVETLKMKHYLFSNCILLIAFINTVVMSGCAAKNGVALSDDYGVVNDRKIEFKTAKGVKEERLVSDEILSLFRGLQEAYEVNKADPNYMRNLNKFDSKYGDYWNANALIAIERGHAYYQQGLVTKESSAASKIFDKSISEFTSGLNGIATARISDKDKVYPDELHLTDNAAYCGARYESIFNKVKSLGDDADKLNVLLGRYAGIYNDPSCPVKIRAWSVYQSITHYADKESLLNRMNDAYRYRAQSNNEEEMLYITTGLAWANFAVGNYKKSLKLYYWLGSDRIKTNAKDIYNSDDLLSIINHYKPLVAKRYRGSSCGSTRQGSMCAN